MGLTSALNTSLNGLSLNETTIDVLGNNIANAGTNGFKASSVEFQTQLARTLSVGSRPTTNNGGTNPLQIGLGASTAAISTDFSQGSVTTSTSPSDLAIQGDGFFVVSGQEGNVYTRAGNFSLNSEDKLITPAGYRVQGYGVDQDFNLVTTQLTDIAIPLGDLNVAQATRNVEISGALLSVGTLATQGSQLASEALTNTSGGAAATNPITAGTLLTSVYHDGGATSLFAVGDDLKFAPRKGGRIIASEEFAVTATSTVADLMAFFDNMLGIQDETANGMPLQPDGQPPGVTVNAAGQLVIRGNQGSVNDVTYSLGDLTKNGSTVDLSMNKSLTADGESSITDFLVYDSLGEQVNLKLTSVLESRTSTSTTFRYFLESADDSAGDFGLTTGVIHFDGNGRIDPQTAIQTFSINRDDTAALSPMQISINFSDVSGISTPTAGSSLTLQLQDGSNPGTLSNFVIDEAGVINGVFDNGIIRTLGQVVLSRFSNPQGLVQAGLSTYREGVASGEPFIVKPGSFGGGTIRSGAIELSNTDIGRSLVDLIVASTNYRGNARVIDSVQQLIDELLVLGR